MAGMRIGVVGAGIIGLAVARRLAELRPGTVVTVFEKEGRDPPDRSEQRRRARRASTTRRDRSRRSCAGAGRAAARATAWSGAAVRRVREGRRRPRRGEIAPLHEIEPRARKRTACRTCPGSSATSSASSSRTTAGIAGLRTPTSGNRGFGAVARTRSAPTSSRRWRGRGQHRGRSGSALAPDDRVGRELASTR